LDLFPASLTPEQRKRLPPSEGVHPHWGRVRRTAWSKTFSKNAGAWWIRVRQRPFLLGPRRRRAVPLRPGNAVECRAGPREAGGGRL